MKMKTKKLYMVLRAGDTLLPSDEGNAKVNLRRRPNRDTIQTPPGPGCGWVSADALGKAGRDLTASMTELMVWRRRIGK